MSHKFLELTLVYYDKLQNKYLPQPQKILLNSAFIIEVSGGTPCRLAYGSSAGVDSMYVQETYEHIREELLK